MQSKLPISCIISGYEQGCGFLPEQARSLCREVLFAQTGVPGVIKYDWILSLRNNEILCHESIARIKYIFWDGLVTQCDGYLFEICGAPSFFNFPKKQIRLYHKEKISVTFLVNFFARRNNRVFDMQSKIWSI